MMNDSRQKQQPSKARATGSGKEIRVVAYIGTDEPLASFEPCVPGKQRQVRNPSLPALHILRKHLHPISVTMTP
jgi:hypothetical protein